MSKTPIAIELEAEKNYYWCACGKSSKVPLCDGAHKGSEIKSVKFNVSENQIRYLCTCLQTKNPPFCDGSHNA